MKRALCISILAACTAVTGAAQDETATFDLDVAASLANSRPDYLVTPADVYSLTYVQTVETTTKLLVVQDDYVIHLGALGSINARGFTVRELREELQRRVSVLDESVTAELVVRAVGVFEVLVRGEVSTSGHVLASGISRLDDVLEDLLIPSSSVRDVRVQSTDGRTRTYDLHQARRFGAVEHNPYVRPGDSISVSRAQRQVTILGAVRRPGTYQLQTGEQIDALVQGYGDGMVPQAEPRRIQVRSIPTDPRQDIAVRTVDLTRSASAGGRLNNGDVVVVPRKEDFQPPVYFEGALRPTAAEGEPLPADGAYRRVAYRFFPGEQLSDAVRAIQAQLAATADLGAAELFRADASERVSVDLTRLLYDLQPDDDLALEPGDRIVVPYREFQVVLRGEVTRAGAIVVPSNIRLSEVLEQYRTPHGSIRNVTVASRSGQENRFDLFRARRSGDESQDPRVNLGDVITVARADRQVTLEGAVRRPGTYQLTGGQQVWALIDEYGDGLLPQAEPRRVVIRRVPRDSAADLQVTTVDVTAGSTTTGPALRDGDTVVVLRKESFQPAVFFEGALIGGESLAAGSTSYRRVAYRFISGEMLSDALRAMQEQLDPSADLRRAELLRRGDDVGRHLDLDQLLYQLDPPADLELQAGDRISIPRREFRIQLRGEVTVAGTIVVPNTVRLGQVVAEYRTPFGSTRDVRIESISGQRQEYDLFRASRYGEADQDPQVRAGDVITVGRAARSVEINGAVRRPGVYQLLEGEQIDALMSTYADGLAPGAEARRVTIRHAAASADAEPQISVVDATTIDDSDSPLRDGDFVQVPTRDEFAALAYFEGAFLPAPGAAETDAYARIPYRFTEGRTLADALRSLEELIAPSADLSAATVVRRDGARTVEVNLEELLSGPNPPGDMSLMPGDRIVVPLRELFVTVSGAVNAPGQYPYVPGRTYQYYLGRAGGVVVGRHFGESPRLQNGNRVGSRRLDESTVIQPGDRIHFRSNHPLFVFNSVVPTISAVVNVGLFVVTVRQLAAE